MNSYKKPEDEIKFRELLKNPIRLFGWVFPFFLVLILALGIFFVKHLSDISFNIQTVDVPDSTFIKKDIEMKRGGVMAPVNLELVKSPTPEFIEKGKEIYNANCKSCHGDNGMGNGAAAAALVKKPRNFHSADGWTNGRTIDEMFKTLQEGITKNGMAAYEYIPPSDRFAVISFIRTLAKFPPVNDDQLKDMDALYKLSSGATIPNTIPVKIAENKLVEESSSLNDLQLRFESKVFTTQGNPGADLLKKSSADYQKIFSTFIRSNANVSMEKFVSAVIANPVSSGFKPTVEQFSKEEWKQLYDYLKTVTM